MRLSLAIAVTLVATTVHADEFTDSPGHSSIAMALSTCESMLKASSSPGMISTHDFWDYTKNVADARSADPAILDKTRRVRSYLGMAPSTLLPRCEALVAAYVRGVDADKQPALDAACERNVTRNLQDLVDQATSYQKDRSGSITLMRMDLEQARRAMYGKGITSAMMPCAPNDQFKKAFAPLATKLAAADQLAARVEAAAGVKFAGVKHGNELVFVDLKTGQPLDHQPK